MKLYHTKFSSNLDLYLNENSGGLTDLAKTSKDQLINNYCMRFCDIQNNQGRGKCYQPKPKAEADNTYRDLDYSGNHKTESHNCFIIHCFKENDDERTVEEASRRDMFFRRFVRDATHHALRAQPTDYSLIC